MKIINFLGLLLFLFYVQSCYKETIVFDSLPDNELELALILELNGKDCFFDKQTNSLRYSIGEDSIQSFMPSVRFQDYSEIVMNNIPLINKRINDLGKIKLNETYTVKITTKGIVNYLTLTFTNLPMVRIVTPNQIIDEPQKLARFTINYASNISTKVTSFVGIDFRGGSAQFNPKKSYGFSFLNTMDLGSKTSKALFGWNQNEDWILDALYSDGSRLRNKISFEIWKAMNPLKHEAIKSKLVELYVNNECQGLYCLNEQMNAEHLDLSDLEAVLYKATAWGDGGTRFEHLSSAAPSFIDEWDGWEQKYPKPKDRIHWQPLYELRDLVVNKSATEFVRDIDSQIDVAVFIDYYIFLNLVSAADNFGKNIIWVRPNAQAPFFITPWDLDGSWGRFWDGSNMNSTTILTNRLFERLLALNPTNFKGNLKSRWLALRGGVLSFPNLETVFEESFNEMGRSNILAIENLKWSSMVNIQQEQLYLNNWTLARLSFLDGYFSNL
jgi:spore coat protein H